jgi:anti-anti-sigma factor
VTPTPHFQVVPIQVPHGLRLVGELDLLTVPHLEAALEACGNGEAVTLDLAELTFIDSSGLHLISRYAESTNGNGPLRLVNVPPNILQVVRITRLHEHPRIEVEPTE